MSAQGTKRASPGASLPKDPLGNVELSDEHATKLQGWQKDMSRIELIVERYSLNASLPAFEKRRAIAKDISRFWGVALMNHPTLAMHAQHHLDQVALSYLEDLWIVRDPREPRVFTIEFHFKENPFFSNSVLKKEYKYLAPPAAADEKPDADGITPSMLEFSWERDVEPQAMKIEWKDSAKILTKLHPRVPGEDGDDMPAEPGSFFNYFEIAEDPFDIGILLANEVFPEAIDYFLGRMNPEYDSEEDDSESEDDEDEDEIDLEQPRAKKQKK
ncbi:hypothetical protein WOLCODRAFT_135080 [Wolfiporia cocos MD-104 SS10]|uniref:Nucleosome assembly protein n=1 Tax=Wolfiporia cocos (strain MD-104) TaxID=742152 RepID=A0A2H3JBM7_WOLCO|nr:hypothetical protein WOLCODRAFT_135080 [Wolfiporia cocos MD-104 SS10]